MGSLSEFLPHNTHIHTHTHTHTHTYTHTLQTMTYSFCLLHGVTFKKCFKVIFYSNRFYDYYLSHIITYFPFPLRMLNTWLLTLLHILIYSLFWRYNCYSNFVFKCLKQGRIIHCGILWKHDVLSVCVCVCVCVWSRPNAGPWSINPHRQVSL